MMFIFIIKNYNYKISTWYKNNWKFQGQIIIQYYINLLTNNEIKTKYSKIRNDELYNFVFSIVQEKELETINEMGFINIFQALKDEAETIYFKNKEEVNIECPVCLSTEHKVYKNFYNCSHAVCHQCFIQWIPKKTCIRNCPLCRADTQ